MRGKERERERRKTGGERESLGDKRGNSGESERYRFGDKVRDGEEFKKEDRGRSRRESKRQLGSEIMTKNIEKTRKKRERCDSGDKPPVSKHLRNPN